MAAELPVEDASLELTALPPAWYRTSSHDGVETAVTPALCSRFPGRDRVNLVKGQGGWAYVEGWRLENNLTWGVGLLELANAGDFAANIWNDIPVPLHAVILMAIGGTAAGIICIFAFTDSIRAWHNIQFLRRQRGELRADKIRQSDDEQPSNSSVEVADELTKRELRTEVISRWCMDILMGVGAVLISIGTFMAIGGANRTVFLVSNILSGYLGNAPIAFFGLINAIWQAVVWKRMHSHKKAAEKKLQGQQVLATISQRCFNVQLYSIVNGTATIMGGVGSMLTPTFWWGYVILIPVIIASFFCNYWWRKKIGYSRPHIGSALSTNPESIINEIRVASQIKDMIKDHAEATLSHLVLDHEKPDSLFAFLINHGLFEAFCLKLMGEESLGHLLDRSKATELSFDEDSLTTLYYLHESTFWKVAEGLLQTEGFRHFENRRRFFTELLGEELSHIIETEEP